MAPTHLTSNNYVQEVDKSKTPVIIDFYADWCGPCRMMAPVFEKLSKDYTSKLNFLKLDTQDQPDIAEKFEVMSIPTLVMVHNGKEVGRLSGYMPEETLKEIIDNALSKLK